MSLAPGRRSVAALEALDEAEQRLALRSLPEAKRRVLLAHWPSWAHDGQMPPGGAPALAQAASTGSAEAASAEAEWRVWVLLAGRGFGKTRAGAEWLSAFARAHPGASIALVAATAEEARAVMVEGRSGLLAVARPAEREAMVWEPSRRRLVFASGAEARLYSAASPESLRGPEHHVAWCDELAKWKRGEATWNNLRLGLRLGNKPQALVTTTPRSLPLLKRILALPGTERTGGGTRGNPHLPEDFIEAAEQAHKGTRFGRQELEGVLVEDVEGAWWTRSLIEGARVELGTVTSNCPLRRIVVGVDPPASAEGTCGIVVCGEVGGICYLLADCSASGLSPEGWARRVAEAAASWGAHRVVAERNNGGTMVEAVLRGADAGLPVSLVHAADGKAARAEPVAILFENGKAKFAGAFPELEDELAGFTPEGWQGEGRSPDRADAMIWAMTELGVRKKRAEPRIRFL